MKKPIVAFTPADKNNLKYYEMMKNSLRKFHTEEELPLVLIDEAKVATYNDPMFFYKATPIIAKELLQEYETVIKLDADMLIFDNLSEAWQGDFDVAVVNNGNPKEIVSFPYQFQNIHPLAYVNNGFVVIKNEEFVDLWNDFCKSMFFGGWQMREQDILNLLVFSTRYKIKRLDEGDSFWGLASKQYGSYMQLQNNKIVLPANANGEDNWPDKQKIIKAYHFAGGQNDPAKGNYRIQFPEEIVKHIDELVKP